MEKGHTRSYSLIYLLERTLRQTRMSLQAAFNKADLKISVDQWIVLSQVAKTLNQNQKIIAKCVAKDPASITRIVLLLENRKLIKRTVDKKDKRNLLVNVSPIGEKLLNACTTEVELFKKNAVKSLAQDDLNNLKTMLDNLFQNCGGGEKD
jgi:MarR family transcriptional regulator, transcriptional regulator for hemolysin